MNNTTEAELKKLLSYKVEMIDDGFTESVSGRLNKNEKRKNILILAATLLATLCACGLANLSTENLFEVILKLISAEPKLLALSILGAVASYFLLPKEST